MQNSSRIWGQGFETASLKIFCLLAVSFQGIKLPLPKVLVLNDMPPVLKLDLLIPRQAYVNRLTIRAFK